MDNPWKEAEMSLSWAGLGSLIESVVIDVQVDDTHPLIRLANILDWYLMSDIVTPDLKRTRRGFWWVGRKLVIRIHLGVFLLQSLYKETDRGIEERIKYNAAFRLFCGCAIIAGWHVPHHTKISMFRNRLSAETQRRLIDTILLPARNLGFADPSWMDVDSTVQEANMAYPSDAVLMVKLVEKCRKVFEYLRKSTRNLIGKHSLLDISSVRKKAQEYFFMAKNTAIEKKRRIFKELHSLVKKQVYPILEIMDNMDSRRIKKLPWNIARDFVQIKTMGKRYLLDVAHFIRTHSLKPGKILSFHAQMVACIKKGKLGKEFEFGRVFQLGRIGGNYFIVTPCDSIRMDDKKSLGKMMDEHARIFGEGVLDSICTDKGYYSRVNIQAAMKRQVSVIGIQCPGNVKRRGPVNETLAKMLRDRRAGIEPLIGHIKSMGLRRSRMKTDEGMLASGYRSVLGFNLHQLQKDIWQESKRAA